MLALACDVGASTPTEVSLAQLASDEEAYSGEVVQVVGTVRVFGEEDPSARHYVIEDDRQNRVALLSAQTAASFIGQRVKVVGRFDFSDTSGRLIRVDSIEPSAARSTRGSTRTRRLHRRILDHDLVTVERTNHPPAAPGATSVTVRSRERNRGGWR